jgi:transcriptional regulator with XRE-family HTH domain
LTLDLAPPTLFGMSDDPSILQNEPEAARIVTVVGGNVRRLRERAGLSLRELATRAAVSTSTLSNLEAGAGNPGVETLVHISGALGVPFSELVMPHEPDVLVQRADQGVVVKAEGADFTSRLLVAASGRSVTEVYQATMEPGDLYRAEPHLPGVTESVIVIRGRMRAGPTDGAVELAPGDRATFAADQPHSYEALTSGTQAILVLSYR